MVLTRQRTDVDFGGNLTIIDANRFVENNQPLLASAGMMGPAQTPATLNDVRTVPGPSPGGRFNSGFPLWDGSGRILVSWTQCRLFDTVDPTRIVPCTDARLARPERADGAAAVQHLDVHAFAEHHPADHAAGRRRHGHRGRGRATAHAAAGRHPRQDSRRSMLDADLVAEGAGLLSIRSVYDIMGVDQARTEQRRRHQHRQRFESRARAVRQSPGALRAHREAGVDSGRRRHRRS